MPRHETRGASVMWRGEAAGFLTIARRSSLCVFGAEEGGLKSQAGSTLERTLSGGGHGDAGGVRGAASRQASSEGYAGAPHASLGQLIW